MTAEADLQTLPVHEVLDAIAEKTPVPGGGAVAGLTAALASAMGAMVMAFSKGKKRDADDVAAVRAIESLLDGARAQAFELAARDAAAYAELNRLWKLPEDDAARRAGYDDAVNAAIAAPRAIMQLGLDVLTQLDIIAPKTNHWLGSDLAIAGILFESAVRAAAWNVRINLPSLRDDATRSTLETYVASGLETAAQLCRSIEDGAAERAA